MPETAISCAVRVDPGFDSDEEERVDLTSHLHRELLTLEELVNVEPAVVAAMPGSKSAGIDLQSLIVTLAASGGVLTTLIGFIQNWVSRREKASVILEVGGDKLTITGASSETERRLVDNWVSRHGA